MSQPVKASETEPLLLAHRALLRDAYTDRGLVETAWVRVHNEACDLRRDSPYRARATALASALLDKIVRQWPPSVGDPDLP